jgi:hypothetical protein
VGGKAIACALSVAFGCAQPTAGPKPPDAPRTAAVVGVARPEGDFAPVARADDATVPVPGPVVARLGAVVGVGLCPRLYAVPIADGRTLWVAWCGTDAAGSPTYVLLVHDPQTQAVTETPPRIEGKLTAASAAASAGGPAVNPFVVFDDLNGDGRLEVAVPEVVPGESPETRRILARWFLMQPTTELVPFLTLESARPWPFFKEGPGTLVRRVERGDDDQLRVTVRFVPDADPRAARDLGTVHLARDASGVWIAVERDAIDPAFEDLLWEDDGR